MSQPCKARKTIAISYAVQLKIRFGGSWRFCFGACFFSAVDEAGKLRDPDMSGRVKSANGSTTELVSRVEDAQCDRF